MKKLLLPLFGASLITMFSAFTCDGNIEEYDDGIASDTVVKETKDTVIKIKNLPPDECPDEWAD